jgi:D-serine deaminase-like pyridoxal phosphate-dependent protein
MGALAAVTAPRGLDLGARIVDVPTPALILDLDRLERNLAATQRVIAGAGCSFRPHAKAHKSVAIMQRQLSLGAAGVAVAKTAEAEVMVAGGCPDVVVAYPVVGAEKWQRLAALARLARIGVNVESEVAARGLSVAAERHETTLRVYLEVDTGLRRTGIPASELASLATLGRTIMALPGLELVGVTGYRGLAFPGAHELGADAAGREEALAMAAVADGLREHGLPIEAVVAGSTATASAVARTGGVTELRAGAYLFQDGAQVAAGVADPCDAALTVLTTVTSVTRPGYAIVDAGSKTFAASAPAGGGTTTVLARAADGDDVVVRLNEEHGFVQLAVGRAPQLGDRLRFIPYHASAAVNLADELIGVRGGVVEERFAVDARGCRT